MKAMLQLIVAAACAATLVACGGGDKTPATVVVAQPAYKMTETKVGTGDLVAASGDTVTIKYTGYLYSETATTNGNRGAKIMSTYDNSTTFTYTVGVGAGSFTVGSGAGALSSVGAGWDQTLVGMRVGGTRTAILPDNLGFGANKRDAVTVNGITYAAIPANSPTVFDFEMVSITKAVIIPNEPAPTTLVTKDLVIGTGPAAVNGQTATVRYTGWLYDGTRENRKGAKFDDNLATTDAVLPTVIGSTDTVTGFNTGIIGMQVGGTRTVIIPPALGYGATARPAGKYGIAIPANSTMVFDITLVSIK
ncbi:FKBP-type peptidyl-prolyl cis-trans isomerase [Duganella sp. sic0402]|uniref:FKBP-type peptidyl-prolyl cis-trans isomerase n=1 Tax=Duganella sp. sic0402 TaxID=2854786 RepID=UPI001C482E1F|nr:FKBP-type peptidyl-prolyl cis-trans isomerase [Duganella sp. sic0402]MBV7539205.1 FKBP-type peptidyl-prolyl cis-trans isomerase [Duganella sp. sic0402]